MITTPTHKLPAYLKWLALALLVITASVLWFYSEGRSSSSIQWQPLAPGLDYIEIDLKPGTLHAFKIDLRQNHLRLISPQQPLSVKEMATSSHALITTNAGFFTPEGKTLGLRIDEGKVLSPLKPISWWGVFYLQNNLPAIRSLNNFILADDIPFAVQAGPRLLVDKSIPRLKDGLDNRTAIGYNAKNDVILIVTENAQLSTLDLAKLMAKPEKQGGLGCLYALNLDGGSSSQVYAQVGHFTLDVPSYRAVADGLAVFPNNRSS